MSNRANKTQGKGKMYASQVSGFDHNGFAVRKQISTVYDTIKEGHTLAGTDERLAKCGLKRTGKVRLRTKLGNTIELNEGNKQ